jgi:hypothetical protein
MISAAALPCAESAKPAAILIAPKIVDGRAPIFSFQPSLRQ